MVDHRPKGDDGLNYPLTEPALEHAAKALAEACNGGHWDIDYNADQRELWRRRVSSALAEPQTKSPAASGDGRG